MNKVSLENIQNTSFYYVSILQLDIFYEKFMLEA